MDLTVGRVLEATGGRLIQGSPDTPLVGVSTDSRSVGPRELFIALPGERFDGHQFVAASLAAGAGAVLVSAWPVGREDGSAGASPSQAVVLVGDTLAAYGALASWWRKHLPARVVAITGSNGKTTTKEMIAHLLEPLGPTVRSEANHNNHIGVPETLLRLRPHHAFAVVEMGTNHPGELERLAAMAAADVAVITNIGQSHLEAFHSLRGVAAEKARILDFGAEKHLAVLHADDPWSRRIAATHQGPKTTFGLAADAAWRAEAMWAESDSIRFILAGCPRAFIVPVYGRHQVSNCLAAIAVADAMGLSPEQAAERFLSFRAPRWRMDFRRLGDLTLIVDCYNANPASMRAALDDLALRAVPGRRVAMLGDMLELGRGAAAAHRRLGRLVADAGFDILCAVGRKASLVGQAALAQGMATGCVYWTEERALASEWLCARLRPNDTVLLKGSRGVKLEEVGEAIEAWARGHACTRPAPDHGLPASAGG